MPRVTGRTGKVFVQTSAGTLYPFNTLTAASDAQTFEAGAGKSPWSDTPAPIIRIDGVLSGLQAKVDDAAANDTVDIEAGTIYQAGVKKTIAAGSLATLARPLVATNLLITAITIDSAAALAKVAGTEGAAGGARGAAGGPPFIPVGSILLAEVTLTSTAAAKVDATEIDNTPAERGDTPGWDPDHYNGKIKLQLPLDKIHTGSVPRRVYAQYRVVTLAEVADLSEWNVDVKKDTVDTMGFGDKFKKSIPSFRSWSGSAKGFLTSPYWFDKANRDGYVLVKFRHHEDALFEFVGVANVDWGLAVPTDGAVVESMSFAGKGELLQIPV